MPVPYSTDYHDYDKHNQLAQLIYKSKQDIDIAYFDGSYVQDGQKLSDLFNRSYRLSTDINRVEHAIDSINYVLKQFGDYFDDFVIGEASDVEDRKDLIDDVPLASIYIDPATVLDYKIKDLDEILEQIPDQYIAVQAHLALPIRKHKVASNVPDSALTIDIFVQHEWVANLGD